MNGVWFGIAIAGGLGIFSGAEISTIFPDYQFIAAIFIIGGVMLAVLFFALALIKNAKIPSSLFYQTSWLSRLHRRYFFCGLLFLAMAGGMWRLRNFREQWRASENFITANAGQVAAAKIKIIASPDSALDGSIAGRWHTVGELQNFPDASNYRWRFYGIGEQQLPAGAIITAEKLKVFPSNFPMFPRAFDFTGYLRQENTGGAARIAGVYTIEINPEKFSLVERAKNVVFAWRKNCVMRMLRLFPDERGGFLAAIVCGVDDHFSERALANFRFSGLGHLLAISGMHVGLVAAVMWIISGWLTTRRRWRWLLVAAAVIFFLLLSGGKVSALRAGIITLFFCGAGWSFRRADFLNSLGLSALVILAINPEQLFAVGFQLSYLAVIFLSCGQRIREEFFAAAPVGATPRESGNSLTERMEVPALWRRVLRCGGMILRENFLLCLAATFATAPLMAYYFNLASPIGLLVNLLSTLLLAGALIGAGVIFLLPTAWLVASTVLRDLCALPVTVLLKVAAVATDLPGAWWTAFAPPPIFLAVYYLFFAILFGCSGIILRRYWRCWLIALIGFTLPCFIGAVKKIPASPPGFYLLAHNKYERIFYLDKAQKLRIVLLTAENNWNEIARFVAELGRREIEEIIAPETVKFDEIFLRRFVVKKHARLEKQVKFGDDNLVYEKFADGGSYIRFTGDNFEWRPVITRNLAPRKLTSLLADLTNTEIVLIAESGARRASQNGKIDKLARRLMVRGFYGCNMATKPTEYLLPRKNFGAIAVGEKSVRAFDGIRWQEWEN